MQASHLAAQLAGYQEVSSLSGQLFVLPDNLYEAIYLEESPVPPIFQSRAVRPHRIHISRVRPDRDQPYQLENKRVKKTVSSIIFGKLVGPNSTARKFFKFVIHSTPIETQPSTPFSIPNTPRPVPKTRPSIRRPFSWSPGADSSRMRSPLVSRKENKRRSLAILSPALRHVTSESLSPVPLSPLSNNLEANISTTMLDTQSLSRNSSPAPTEKPLVSGSGVSVSLSLAEPNLFVQGFEHGDLAADRSTAMLRGCLNIKVTKPSKIKTITLKFKGTSTTKWPEGIPPKKVEFEEVSTIMSHTWPFFNAQFPNAEQGTGADCVTLTSKPSVEPVNKRGSLDMRDVLRLANSSTPSLSKAERRMSVQVNSVNETSVAQKGYRTFQPGEYSYNFELPIDSHLPETLDLELGSVKYGLEATVERSGAFRGNLVGAKEVFLIRTPAEGSMEQVEPIAIARNWDDQLHYDIVISGKSFPLGSQIPIAFKLTPLAKVQCHRIKVFLTESAEYFCQNRKVHRTEPVRKVLLFEKRAGNEPTSTYPGSTMRIVSGGGVPYDQRAAAARGEPVTADASNILGNLDRSEGSIGPTELEISAQLPTCVAMGKDKNARIHPDSAYANVQCHHSIKV
jgi:hypothetical protein